MAQASEQKPSTSFKASKEKGRYLLLALDAARDLDLELLLVLRSDELSVPGPS